MDELERAIQQLMGRMFGPMNFRLIIQPIVAIVFAIRAGLKDARDNKPPYLWELITSPTNRRQLLHSTWKDVGRVFIIAFLIDVIYQIFVLKFFYPLQSLIVAFALAFLPYILLRGPITRLSARFKTRGK